MQISLEQLIECVLEELKKKGLTSESIKSYSESAYSPLIKYCARNGTTYYEPTVLNEFLNYQKKRLENNEISERYFRKLRRAVLMAHDQYQNGAIPDRRYDPGSKYKTNEYFSLWLKQFLDAQHLGERTLGNLRSGISIFLHYLENTGHTDFSTVSPEDVKKYLLLAAERNNGGMPNILYALRLFLDYLESNSCIPQGFLPVLSKAVRKSWKVLPCFSRKEVEEIIGQIDTNTKQGKRDYAILLLAAHTGLRSTDITHLRLSDINWLNDSIHVVQNKTGQPLILPLEANTGNAIAKYILEARPESTSEYVFLRLLAPHQKLAECTSLNNILKKYLKSTSISHQPGDGKSFHSLRRSMGTWMLESGVPLTTISQVLGHKKQDSTKQYLSMDYKRLAECALDFQGIPVRGESIRW